MIGKLPTHSLCSPRPLSASEGITLASGHVPPETMRKSCPTAPLFRHVLPDEQAKPFEFARIDTPDPTRACPSCKRLSSAWSNGNEVSTPPAAPLKFTLKGASHCDFREPKRHADGSRSRLRRRAARSRGRPLLESPACSAKGARFQCTALDLREAAPRSGQGRWDR